MSNTNPTAGNAAHTPEDGEPKQGTLVKTSTPGVYRKVGAKSKPYVAVFRAGGKQRKRACRTLEEARRVKREAETDHDRGEYQAARNVTLHAYLREWIETYRGNGRQGFRENTRTDYRRNLELYAYRYFGERLKLTDVTRLDIAAFIRWLDDPGKQNGRVLGYSGIVNALMPIRSALATATRDGLLRVNPADKPAIPRHERIEEDDEEQVRVLSRDQLAQLLALAPPKWSVLLDLLASTGLRISEALALQRRHILLDTARPHVRVRRGVVRGRIGPPKSRHGRREVPISQTMARKLREHLAAVDDQSDDALVFASRADTTLVADNVRKRVLRPLMEAIGAPWAGFHTLRHTYASIQLAEGCNVLQLSKALGHHGPSFTLDTYCHLLEGEETPALDLAAALADADDGQCEGNKPHVVETHEGDAVLREVA